MQGKILNNRYKIIKEIGRGGMAIVYSARDRLLERVVALKMLRPEYSSDSEFKEKFRQEARAVAKLSHPNVVSIYDIVTDENNIYLVMEIVKGETLKDIIKRRGKLSIAEALEFARQIAAALSIAHGNQIVHCDIKPQNIILTDDMEVKITDFGIAKAVTSSTAAITETVVGSAHYFSPEQAKGGKIKAYSDIYSLGVVLYEMVTGELPFQGESPISVALKHIQQQAVSPAKINNDIPKEVNDLIMKAMAKDPADRFQDADEMRHQITFCLKNLKNTGEVLNDDQDEFDGTETKIMKKSDFNLDKIEGKDAEEELKGIGKLSSEADESSNGKLDFKDEKDKKDEETAYFKLNNSDNQNSRNNTRSSKDKKVKKDDNNGESGSDNGSTFKTLTSMAVILILISALLVGGGIYFFNSYTDVPIVEVPNVEGKSLSEARSLAGEVGINLNESEERVYSDEVAENHIVSQQPEAGERIKQSRPLNITVSRGPRLVELPNFSGQSLREALVELENLSLKSGDIQYIFRLSVEPGTVINQIPAAGAEVASGSEITLYVSRGERNISVSMPDLSGLSQDEAVDLLRSKGLNVGDITVERSERFLNGQVISQSVQPGEYLPRGIAVDFVISRGSSNTSQENTHINRISVNITGLQSREVKIEVIDENGRDIVYNALHQPGDSIIRDIQSIGKTEVKIYFDNQLIKSETFGG